MVSMSHVGWLARRKSMSTSKNLKLTTRLGGLLTPQFLSMGLAVLVTAVLLPVGKSAAWGDDKGDNEGKADRGAVRLLKTIPIPGDRTQSDRRQTVLLRHQLGRSEDPNLLSRRSFQSGG